jgi:hypothetical protein
VLKVDELRGAGGFIEDLGVRVDWFYQLVVSFRSGVVFSPEVTAQYTVGQNESFSSSKLGDESVDMKCLGRMLELLQSRQFEDVRDDMFIPSVVRAAPKLLPRLAVLASTDPQYSKFRDYPAVREAIEETQTQTVSQVR